MDPIFCLIHSPLVGPVTWEPVAAELRGRGLRAVVPDLTGDSRQGASFWRLEASLAAQAIQEAAGGDPIALAGHSGAGMLLPPIRQMLDAPAVAYLFIDAGLPQDGASRLQMMKAESPEWAAEFRRFLEEGGRFPDWREEDLRELVPDDGLRSVLVQQIQPRGMEFFIEPIPAFPGWPDAPCGYLLFSPPYEPSAAQARRRGWPVEKLEAGHFHMLADPGAVADWMMRFFSKAPV